jgi:hypothetical protein
MMSEQAKAGWYFGSVYLLGLEVVVNAKLVSVREAALSLVVSVSDYDRVSSLA